IAQVLVPSPAQSASFHRREFQETCRSCQKCPGLSHPRLVDQRTTLRSPPVVPTQVPVQGISSAAKRLASSRALNGPMPHEGLDDRGTTPIAPPLSEWWAASAQVRLGRNPCRWSTPALVETAIAS